MPAPTVVIDLDIIAENMRRVVASLDGRVGVFGVTKATCGSHRSETTSSRPTG